MHSKKIIFVAKCFETSLSGPANIVRNLIKYSKENKIDIEEVLMTEKTSKKDFISKVIHKCFFTTNNVVITHTDGFLISLLVLFISYFNKRNKYYLTVHGVYVLDNGNKGIKNKIYCLLERILYNQFPNIICVSNMLADDLAKIFDRKKSIRIIPNATDAFSYEKPKNENTLKIIFLGGLKFNKGIKASLELLEVLKNNNISYNAFIYGSDAGNLTWYNDQIVMRGLEKYVKYCGILFDKQEVYDALSKADIQLCLSDYDTFNVAIAESLVLGCPVISSDKCGAAYLISGESGIVISIEDERKSNYKETVAYIEKIREKDFRWLVYERRIRYVEQLSWRNVVQEYASL